MIDSISRKPIADALITVLASKRMAASTDASGRYLIEGIPSGSILLGGSRSRDAASSFFTTYKKVRLLPGQRLRNFTIELPPESTLAGRVIDYDTKKPMQGWLVTLGKLNWTEGVEQFAAAAEPSRSNEDGAFRLTCRQPGRYLISASPAQLSVAPIQKPPLDPEEEEPELGYVQVYHPGVDDVRMATNLSLSAGEERGDVLIAVQKQRTFRARFRFIGEDGNAIAQQIIFLISRTWSGGSETVARGQVTSTLVEVAGLGAGSYSVSAWIAGQKSTERRRVDQVFELVKRNPPVIDLRLRRGSELTGVVLSAEDSTKSAIPQKLRVLLAPIGRAPAADEGAAEVDSEGRFGLPNVGGGDYWLHMVGLPREYCVEQATSGSTNLMITPLKIDKFDNRNEIKIVLAKTAGRVAGIVSDGDNPVSGAQVVLASIPISDIRSFRQIQTTITDQSGAYSFERLRPGKYKLFPLDGATANSRIDPLTLAAVESKATEVEISASGTMTVGLRLIPLP